VSDYENTERPDRERAQEALRQTPSDIIRTAEAVADSQRMISVVRGARRDNHFADKLRQIIIAAQH
jgi:hypothetical protein